MLALGAQTAAAEGFSYSFIEGSYAFADLEGVDGDGFGIRGSTELAPSIHIFSGLQNLGFDGGFDLDTLNIGVGLNWSLSDNADLVGGLSYERVDAGPSESGFGVSGGLRGRVGNNLELNAGIKYSDIGDFGDTFTYTAGGRWYFTPAFAVGAEYNKLDLGDANIDGEAWVISLRYDFGDRM
jgi:hypothetical protein